ncbi:MAG TPA: UPF0182 family protein, partial [Massilibacterium sp.]|nr:UPF0182 family protein [Massilibacterium sp.]
SQGGSEVIRGNLLVIPIEDTVLYVEPVYIESSNETSLPEVKQVIMADEDHIVMEETFDKSLEKILGYIDGKTKSDDEPKEETPEADKTQEEMEQEPILNAEEALKEIGTLFDAYQKALSDGDWAKAGEIMEELEEKLK